MIKLFKKTGEKRVALDKRNTTERDGEMSRVLGHKTETEETTTAREEEASMR